MAVHVTDKARGRGLGPYQDPLTPPHSCSSLRGIMQTIPHPAFPPTFQSVRVTNPEQEEEEADPIPCTGAPQGKTWGLV